MQRPTEGRVLGGVAAAIAEQTGGSVGLIRLGFVVAAMFGGLGVIVYAAAWALLPGKGDEETPAERWLGSLTTPGKRFGAFLIGAAALVLLAGAHHAAVVAALVLLAAAVLLTNRPSPTHQSTTAGIAGNETE